MVEREIFPNAPITEALLDIRVTLPENTSLEQLAMLHEIVKDHYPNKRERKMWQSAIHVKDQGPEVVKPSGGTDGYLFSSSDGKNIVQSRLDGFTFNRLKPYDRWESFRDESYQLWQKYIKVAAPTQITRVALRYINRIEIPLPFRDFKDYILTTPEIAPGLPQGLARFFFQLAMPIAEIPALAIITETMEPVTETKRLPFILDIDVVREAAFDVNGQQAWATLDKLHDVKNDIFFKSITPKAKELFR
jgi:uncharacterized protein (TIGR04255 family)